MNFMQRFLLNVSITPLAAKEFCRFSDRNKAVLMNIQSSHKWWSTLKSAVFTTSSSLPPLVNKANNKALALLLKPASSTPSNTRVSKIVPEGD